MLGSLSHAESGGGGAKSVHPLKRGSAKRFTVLGGGGGYKKIQTCHFSIL